MVTKRQSRALGLTIAVSLSPVFAFAHHSTTEFNFSEMQELTGEVVQVQWRNPHIRVNLLVRNVDGSEKVWHMEAQDVNGLDRAGIPRDLVQVGQTVTVAGTPSSRREQLFLMTNLMLPDGREIVTLLAREPRWTDRPIGDRDAASGRPEEFVAPVNDIFRAWTHIQSNGPDFGGSPPLTAAARAGYEAFDPGRDDPVLGCVAPGMPEAMTYIGRHPVGFTRMPNGDIRIGIESDDNVRVIHMDPAANAENQPPSALGYSVGRWEGDDLHVRTTRINWPYFKVLGLVAVPQSPAIEIVERFALNRELGELVYDFSATDPATFMEPVVTPRYHVWRYRPGVEVQPYDCTLDGE